MYLKPSHRAGLFILSGNIDRPFHSPIHDHGINQFDDRLLILWMKTLQFLKPLNQPGVVDRYTLRQITCYEIINRRFQCRGQRLATWLSFASKQGVYIMIFIIYTVKNPKLIFMSFGSSKWLLRIGLEQKIGRNLS